MTLEVGKREPGMFTFRDGKWPGWKPESETSALERGELIQPSDL